MGDFQTIYGMTRCLTHHCDPYNADQIRHAYVASGGVVRDPYPFRVHEPLYLPPALLLTIPYALFPWTSAHLIWLTVNIGTFLAAVVLIARLGSESSPLASVCMLSLLVLTSLPAITVGNPALLTIGLAGIALWCFIEEKWAIAGVCCLAVSLAYKPHISGLVWLYLLIAGGTHRKRAMQVLLVTTGICLTALLWITVMPESSHWLNELQANIAGTTGPGGVADPGPHNPTRVGASAFLNLQTIVSLFWDDPSIYNMVSRLICACFLLAWLYPVFRLPPSREKDFRAIAVVACVALLAVYHQQEDSALLLLTLPAFALTMADKRRLRIPSFCLVFIIFILVSNKYQAFSFEHLASPLMPLGRWGTILWLRQLPTCLLILAVFYLAIFYSEVARRRKQSKTVESLP